MRFIDILAFGALVLVVAVGQVMRSGGESERGGDSGRRPDPRQFEPARDPRETREPGRRLDDPSMFDPTITIDLEAKGTSSGTAFSLGQSGYWMTARHVTEGCSRLAIVRADGSGVYASRVLSHPSADISVMWTNGGAPSLALSRAPLEVGQEGFHFGFPQGEPGAVYSTLLGRHRMRVNGVRYSTSEPVIAWAERSRDADPDKPLSGISGGPIVDDTGAVVGVHVAGSIRRGRNYSVAPVSIAEMVEMARLDLTARNASRFDRELLTGQSFPEAGRRLRGQLTVAKVLCFVDGAGNRGRRPRH